MATRKPAKKAKPALKRNSGVTIDVISTAASALSELYPSDNTVPGLVLAFIPGIAEYYASMVRYDSPTDKRVIAKCYGKTMDDAISGLICEWKNATKSARKLRRFASVKGFDFGKDKTEFGITDSDRY